jgi:hypothetical protein
MYQVYATKTQLAEYLGMAEAALPSDSDRLLRRASELVAQMVGDNPDLTNPDHIEALQLATCAQVEYWNTSGESSSVSGQIQNFSLGGLSMNMGSNLARMLCKRSQAYLNRYGLLYAGAKMGFHDKDEESIIRESEEV